MSSIYVVRLADGTENLVRAHTKNGAATFKRREIARKTILSAAKATQDDLVRLMAKGATVEHAIDEDQADIGDGEAA